MKDIIIKEDISIDDIPIFTPYATFNEYCLATGNPNNLTSIEYLYMYAGNPIINQEIKTLTETMEASHYATFSEFNQLKELGWIPGAPINSQTIQYARERQLQWFKENCIVQTINFGNTDIPINEITELEKSKTATLTPIFITALYEPSPAGLVIKLWGTVTGQKWKYIHSGLSLDSSLSTVHTFLFKGYSQESLPRLARNKANAIRVTALFINSKQKAKIFKALSYYKANQDKTSYSFSNIARIMFKMGNKRSAYSTSMMCSEFVEALLKGANIDSSGKDEVFTAPEDVGKNTDKINAFTVYEGKATDYNKEEVDKKIKQLQNSIHYNHLKAVKTKAERDQIEREKQVTIPDSKKKAKPIEIPDVDDVAD